MSQDNSERQRVAPRRLSMTMGVGAAVAVLVVAVVLVGPFLRLPSNQVGGDPSGSPDGSTPVASAEASAICEFFAEGGPESLITTPATVPAMAFPDTPSAVSPETAAEAMAEAMAAPIRATNQFAERVSGDERDDVLALAATMAEFAAALDKAATTKHDSADWTAINEELAVARDRTLYGEHGPEAFYVKYGPPCGQPLPVVDCGPLDHVTCDATWPEIVAGELEGPYAPPTQSEVTRVNLWGPPDCLSYLVVWLGGFGVHADNDFCEANPQPTPTPVVGSPEVGVSYQVVVHCTADFPLGDTWWRFENAGATPGPVVPDLRGSVPAIVTLTSPDTAILRVVDGSELKLSRVDEPIEASCLGV